MRLREVFRRNPDLWVLVLFVVVLGPLVGRYLGRLWGEPQYQYFPILIGVIGYLGWSRWQEAPPATRPFAWRWALVLAVPLVPLLIAAVLFQVPVLGALAATLGLGIAALGLASHRKVENLVGLWVLCWLLIRPPWGYDEKLMGWLQALTTGVSSRLLDFFGAMHLTEGNVLTFPGKTFFVDEACSGIISLRTMLAATFVIAVYRNRPALHALLLVAAGLFWAGVMNVIRILVIAVAHLKFGLDLAEGWQHDVTGLLVFLFAVGGVMSTDAYLEFFLARIGSSVRGVKNGLVAFWNRTVGWGDQTLTEEAYAVEESLPEGDRRLPKVFRMGFVAILGFFLLLQVVALSPLFSKSSAAAPVVRRVKLDPALLLSKETIQPVGEGWRVVDFDKKERNSRSVWGENSLVWTYVRGNLRVTYSLDYFFRKWHELTVCYRASGWQLSERSILPQQDDQWSTVRARCVRPASREQGLVYFDLFRVSGESLSPTKSVMAADWKERFSLRNMGLFKGAFADNTGVLDVCQVQAFVMTGEELSEEQRAVVRAEYEHFRRQVYAVLMGGGRS